LQIKRKLNATLVGQPTGQGYNHYGDTTHFQLPNSNIEIQYSTKHFGNDDNLDKNIFPDVFIEPTMEEYLAGKDSVLEYVLNGN
jgi:hypothetical protein